MFVCLLVCCLMCWCSLFIVVGVGYVFLLLSWLFVDCRRCCFVFVYWCLLVMWVVVRCHVLLFVVGVCRGCFCCCCLLSSFVVNVVRCGRVLLVVGCWLL